MFLHGGWLHFLGNMLYLWIFGDNVEDRLGHFAFLVFYLVCGAAAGLAHIFMNPASLLPTLGASGAIAGVMGAYFVLYPQSRILTLVLLHSSTAGRRGAGRRVSGHLVRDAVLQRRASAGAESGGVAFWAHVAGFLAGMIWVLVFRKRRVALELIGDIALPQRTQRHRGNFFEKLPLCLCDDSVLRQEAIWSLRI